MDIEDRADLIAYLRTRNILQEKEQVAVTVLAGGVSNRTVLVQTSAKPDFVIKQALPKLRVAVDWYSDPRRIHMEARGLEWLQRLAPPDSTPRLLFEDSEEHVLGMTAIGQPHRNWKEMLLAGEVERKHAGQFGTLLGTIHRRSTQQLEAVREAFDDRTFFETLRLEPYYRYTATQEPSARRFLEHLTAETWDTRLSVVHGDFSPKNILVHEGRLILLDHEVIHFGDPAFDVGFSLTHLLSKAHHVRHKREALTAAGLEYVRRYGECIAGLDWEGWEERAVRHTLGCLLARVAGRSPLEYLSAEERRVQRACVVEMMAAPPAGLEILIANFMERLP